MREQEDLPRSVACGVQQLLVAQQEKLQRQQRWMLMRRSSAAASSCKSFSNDRHQRRLQQPDPMAETAAAANVTLLPGEFCDLRQHVDSYPLHIGAHTVCA